MPVVISVENISKAYRLGQISGRTLREDLNRLWARRRGKPDPYLKVDQVDHGNQRGEYIWALNDVSFEVTQGEVLGIIGRNGAGKSTLLKILSRITSPTSGIVKVKGRSASLLEVGTGFHPELTGRENILLNGVIMGMKRIEITRRFDEIVDFSGVEQFIDTPVKRYSSGMYVRLAFAVAAHLDPEILIIDEVLAVGDATFQKKCLGKMGDVAREGRTVLFVSHNIGAILQLCSRTILLAKGQIILDDQTELVVAAYLAEERGNENRVVFEEDPALPAQIVAMSLVSSSENTIQSIAHTQPFAISLKYRVDKWNVGSYVCVDVFNEQGIRLLWSCDVKSVEEMTVDRQPGIYQADVTIPGGILAPGRYSFTGAIVAPGQRTWGHVREKVISLEITDGGSLLSNFGIKPHSATMIPLTWEVRMQKDANIKRIDP